MKKIIVGLLTLSTFVFTSCSSDDDGGNPTDTNEVIAPATYAFSRNGNSTVSYSGQTTRIQMGEEFITALKDNSKTEAQLDGMFAHVEGNADFSDADLNASGKSIRSKTAASSDYFSANAFALPNGQVVVTDELVELLKNEPDALRAILLHEIGHVQHHHSIRLAAQAAASTVVFAVIFGDLEGILEVVLGSGSSFLQQAFSRDMEQEADEYAIKNLLKLGYSNHDFADAIEALEKNLKAREGTYDETWLKYLSTHPSSQERIEYARQYKPQ